MESQVYASLFALYLASKAFWALVNIKLRLRHKTQNRVFKARLLACVYF